MNFGEVLLASSMPWVRLKNLLASAAVVAASCAIYRFVPYNAKQFDRLYGSPAFSFAGTDFLLAGALAYIGLVGIYFLLEPEPAVSKSLRFFRVLGALVRDPMATLRRRLSVEDRVAVLSTLLKAFFGPMMAMSMMTFCIRAWANGSAIAESGAFDYGLKVLFDQHGFWFLMQLILFVDVLVFTVGYLVETPRLGNTIRSVDPTLIGWAAALLCYPPFNKVSSAILGSPLSDFPHFDDPTTHLVLNILLLALMAIYTSASIALGFKASNLTHRGIIARGPYAFVRHPAYTCKNMAWWIGSLPLIGVSFAQSWFDGVQAIASVVGWTLLYVLRALTEEDHLKSVDAEYAAYAQKVRYRFVPGVI
jgi:hypothetical protein